MRIYQILSELKYGDAVGNDAIALCEVIADMGYETAIYANVIDKRLTSPMYRKFSKLPKLNKDDIAILNHCCGTELCYRFAQLRCRKMMIYHNITPTKFFTGYNRSFVKNIAEGYRQTEFLADKTDYVMADSEYNASDLRSMGFKCPMAIRPILIPFDDYKKQPDGDVIEKYSDGYTNIVFVGRIAPNKKQEDVIAAFAYYKKNINPKSRLIFVGSGKGMEEYGRSLERYVQALNLDDVIFTGHIKFSEILAYYSIADVFVCMSEHEGFCVPLIEAMSFDVPIIAYNSSAIPDTLGGSGVLVNEKNPVFIAMLIDRIVNDKELRDSLIEGQRKRLADFSYENVRKTFEAQLTAFIDGSYLDNNEK